MNGEEAERRGRQGRPERHTARNARDLWQGQGLGDEAADAEIKQDGLAVKRRRRA